MRSGLRRSLKRVEDGPGYSIKMIVRGDLSERDTIVLHDTVEIREEIHLVCSIHGLHLLLAG